jgi:hypothetical protein
MKAEFKMSDLGPLSFYLGIEVHQDRDMITLNKGAYATRIVDKARLTWCNPCATPMEPRIKLYKNSSAPATDGMEYKSLVGSMRYLVNTKPNFAYSVGLVSRFMEKPAKEHFAAVKRIIRYVARTIHLGCQCSRNENSKLVGFYDSDVAGDIDTRKSTTVAAFFLLQESC